MNQLMKRIFDCLSQEDRFFSAGEIAPELSRTMVWKGILQLRQAGCVIEGRSRLGYRLVDRREYLDQWIVAQHLKTQWLGRPFYALGQIDSTNDELKRRALLGAPHGLVLCSDHQTAGRGRQGRQWHSSSGKALQFSCLLRPNLEIEQVSLLTQVAAVACVKALETLGFEAQIKWPNDLWLSGKKCAGILCEMACEANSVHYVIVGIGLNVNQKEFPSDLDQATSLYQQGGQLFDRSSLMATLLGCLESEIDHFTSCGADQVLEFARSRNGLKGRFVRTEKVNGTVLDIDDGGRLVLRCDDGELVRLSSGEVHLIQK